MSAINSLSVSFKEGDVSPSASGPAIGSKQSTSLLSAVSTRRQRSPLFPLSTPPCPTRFISPAHVAHSRAARDAAEISRTIGFLLCVSARWDWLFSTAELKNSPVRFSFFLVHLPHFSRVFSFTLLGFERLD